MAAQACLASCRQSARWGRQPFVVVREPLPKGGGAEVMTDVAPGCTMAAGGKQPAVKGPGAMGPYWKVSWAATCKPRAAARGAPEACTGSGMLAATSALGLAMLVAAVQQRPAAWLEVWVLSDCVKEAAAWLAGRHDQDASDSCCSSTCTGCPGHVESVEPSPAWCI